MLAAHVLMGVGPSLEAGQSPSTDQWELLSFPLSVRCGQWLVQRLPTGQSAETAVTVVFSTLYLYSPQDLGKISEEVVTILSGRSSDAVFWTGWGTALLVYSRGSDVSVLAWLGGGTSQG